MRIRSNDDTQDGFSSTQSRTNRSWRLWIMLGVGILWFVMATGCAASLRVRPSVLGYAVAPVNNVPVAIEGYPRYLYHDRYAYLVDGQWYYPTPDGWVVFLDEPTPLAQYRARVQTAPPATRPPDVYYGYPPPPPQPAPPRELQREYRPQ